MSDEKLRSIFKAIDEIEKAQARLDALVPTSYAELDKLELDENNYLDMYFDQRKVLLKLKQSLRRNAFDLAYHQQGRFHFDSQSFSVSTTTTRLGGESNIRGSGAVLIRSGTESENNRFSEQADSPQQEVFKWKIEPEEIQVNKSKDFELGRGAFGTVYKGKCRGKEVAVKILNKQLNEDALQEFCKEVAVMAKLRHENLLLFMGACVEPGNLQMVTEYLPKGSVAGLLKDKKGVSFRTRMLFAKDTALGMNWLHKERFLHLDLKPANLLVSDNYVVKVADFGLAKMKSDNKDSGAGTPLYMAPEVLTNKEYDEKADVYSFGIVLWELYTQRQVWQGNFATMEELTQAVGVEGERPDVPKDCPEKLANLMRQCWASNPAQRPSFDDTCKSTVFDDIIIEFAISKANELGRKMWKQHFLGKYVVPWKDFLLAFLNATGQGFPKEGSPEWLHYKMVHLICCGPENKAETVTIESFSRMLEWFGPMEASNQLVTRLYALVTKPGFHGEISATDAEPIVNMADPGSFLLRFSATDSGCFAVTGKTKNKDIRHFKIYHRPGLKYVLHDKEYEHVDAVLEALKKNKNVGFKTPIPSPKYEGAVKLVTVPENKLKGYDFFG